LKPTETILDYKTAEHPLQIQQAISAPPEMETLVREMLYTIGEDPQREGLQRTPERVARMYNELLAGYQIDLDALVNGAVFQSEYQDMVIVRDIQFYSLCEHHLLPFYGRAQVAYIPDGKIIGLSKIPRIVEMFARRLQVQERMTHQVAETLQEIVAPHGVAVLVEGTHMCSVMRGVRQEDARMVTSTMLGAFQRDATLRNDFFNQLKLSEELAAAQQRTGGK
jgi:GTP cyclohydrolase I